MMWSNTSIIPWWFDVIANLAIKCSEHFVQVSVEIAY